MSPFSFEVTYRYDAVNRMETVADASGTVTYVYDRNGNQTEVQYPNGAVTSSAYDSLNRPTRVTTKDKAGSVIAETVYTLDAAGHRTRLTEPERTVDYEYDALNRLTKETITDARGTRVTAWAYDKVGNRLTQDENGTVTTYAYDKNDRLLTETTGADVVTYSYDAAGNTTGKTKGGSTVAYRYNDAGRMVQAFDGPNTYSFDYHPDGVRRSKNANGAETYFLIDPNQDYAQVLAEYDASIERAFYVHGSDLLARTNGNGSRWYHSDALGSARSLTDVSGAETDSYDFRAFGQLDARTGQSENAYLFSGEQYDDAIRQYYLRARYMAAEAGRFTQADSWPGKGCQPLSLNKYLYVQGEPVLFVDPSGFMPTLGELMATTDIGVQLRMVSTMSGRTFVRKAGCLVLEEIVEETATGLIYIYLDGVSGLPYVGKTKQDLVRRLDQHDATMRRSVNKLVGVFRVVDGPEMLSLVEQWMIDVFGGLKNADNSARLSNAINAIDKKTGKLKEKLKGLKVCK